MTQSDIMQGMEEPIDSLDAIPQPVGFPFWPVRLGASGLYEWSMRPIYRVRTPVIPRTPFLDEGAESPTGRHPEDTAGQVDGTSLESADMGAPTGALSRWWFAREELRLDVDGRYPQMVASGTAYQGLTMRIHWIADLKPMGRDRWIGSIWYKDGDTKSFPYANVDIQATRSWFSNLRKTTVTFSGGGARKIVRTYRFKSSYFRPVEFEFDTVKGAERVTSIDPTAHPNHPSTLASENLSIETVYRRAGFNVRKSGSDGSIPLADAGVNGTWSDAEMHDAMQAYWSRFANRARWSMWVLFAARHDLGYGLGGIMFDDIGPNHRQGTSMFSNSFISDAPTGDPDPDAWVDRMRFWTAVHEMGHAFNLAHSWQKSLGTPWIPLTDDPEARSFMNYPYYVSGGQSAFFADFEFRFIDEELLFMRHAPARFVQMGNADWFDNHGFEQAEVSAQPKFKLEVRVNRDKPDFEFLEPVVLDLKITNESGHAQLVDANCLGAAENMTVVIKKHGRPARQWAPYARYCYKPDRVALASGHSMYESCFVSAGLNGCDIAEPGRYTICVTLHLEDEDIVSNLLTLRVAPPKGYDEELIAQDFFTEDVGRILAFDGSRHLESGNDTLREIAAKFGNRKVAYHAKVALAKPLTCNYKKLALGAGMTNMTAAFDDNGEFEVIESKEGNARKEMDAALMTNADRAVETLGHIDYAYYVDNYSAWLNTIGDSNGAAKCLADLHRTLSGRKVLPAVLDDIEERRSSYSPGAAPKRTKAALAKG
ncbi:MAG: hypothetical protein JSU63_04750 [Phycisphaerales bacterium]|nr:MAG: hypothetical protein JSU63_04750 [Phycisphaerales bacterium]